MFWAFKLSFDGDVYDFFAWQLFLLLFQNLGSFFPQSGHPDYNTELITAVKSFTLQASGANVMKQYLCKLSW